MSKQIIKRSAGSITGSITGRITDGMTKVLVAVSLIALLGACSNHSNPLKSASTAAAAEFLVHASQYAEKKLGVFNAPGGYYYGECMAGKAQPAQCTKLYSNMIQYANTTAASQGSFKGLSVADLTDQNTFKHLATAYKRQQFDAV